MTDNTDLHDWLVLWHAPKMNPKRFYALLNRFNCLENLLSQEDQWTTFGMPDETKIYFKQFNKYKHLIEEDLSWQTHPKNYIIPFNHPHYPFLLKQTANPPPLLFVKGDPKHLNLPQLAMVGSRRPTPTGIHIAQTYAAELASYGLAITSGLAIGIDTAAHKGALAIKGNTIAVLGSGIECIYPAQNKKLSEEIIEKGAIISEFSLKTEPKKENFPQRNRIVSGLALGTLVVEASLKSGSLITARFSAEQGREVFAIPGSIKNIQAQGCHFLIQQGAKLVSNIDHVLEELKGFDYVAHKNKSLSNITAAKGYKEGLLPLEEKILTCVGYEPTPIDLIKARSGLDIIQVMNILCDLTLKNEVGSHLNGYIKIK